MLVHALAILLDPRGCAGSTYITFRNDHCTINYSLIVCHFSVTIDDHYPTQIEASEMKF